jgi:hypothetical protein
MFIAIFTKKLKKKRAALASYPNLRSRISYLPTVSLVVQKVLEWYSSHDFICSSIVLVYYLYCGRFIPPCFAVFNSIPSFLPEPVRRFHQNYVQDYVLYFGLAIRIEPCKLVILYWNKCVLLRSRSWTVSVLLFETNIQKLLVCTGYYLLLVCTDYELCLCSKSDENRMGVGNLEPGSWKSDGSGQFGSKRKMSWATAIMARGTSVQSF